MPVKKNLKSFKFDIGNSNKGALGMVIRVWAGTKAEAVKIANGYLGEHEHLTLGNHVRTPKLGVEYANVYFGPNLKLRHIDSGETEEVEQ